MAGYSTTPLAKKLGIKPGITLYAVDPPGNYLSILSPLPHDMALATKFTGEVDLIHLFVTSKKKLASSLERWRKAIKQDAAIWVSWPKQAAKFPTDVNEDVIRDIALPLGLVDIKVCAVDDVWSGLKLMIRKDLRRSK
jgi:hypothetical protein